MNTLTKTHVETLLKTWMICEATIHLQDCLRNNKKEVIHQFKACASTCFNIAREMMDPKGFITDDEYIACMVECKNCADICTSYSTIHEIAFCGSLCNECFHAISSVFNQYQSN